MSKTESKPERRKQNINHVNRVIGQLNALKRLMESDATCFEISNLTLSIKNSVNSLGVRVMEGFILNGLLEDKLNEVEQRKLEQLTKILNLYR